MVNPLFFLLLMFPFVETPPLELSSKELIRYEKTCLRARDAVAAKDYLSVAACIDEFNTIPIQNLQSDLASPSIEGHIIFESAYLETLIANGFNKSILTFDTHINRGINDSDNSIYLEHGLINPDSSVTVRFFGNGEMELSVISEDSSYLIVEQLDYYDNVIRNGTNSSVSGCTHLKWTEPSMACIIIRITNTSPNILSYVIASN